MTKKTPGQCIERARLLHHWSQEDLAAHVEVSRQSVYRWEHDMALPTIKIRERIIELLSLPNALFVKKGQQTKQKKTKRASGRGKQNVQVAASRVS